MRLDQYLAEQKIISTRSKAKRAIQLGFVIVNNAVIVKPAHIIKKNDLVTITNKKLAEMPEGYFKLKQIQEQTDIIKLDSIILDLGSSAGGYLLFASEIAEEVYGIEFSRKFEKALSNIKRENVFVTMGDAFTVKPEDVTRNKKIDLILNDLTLDWQDSLIALLRFIPLLKQDGQVLMTIKGSKQTTMSELMAIEKAFASNKLKITNVLQLPNIKREFYILAKKLAIPEQ